MVFLRSSRPTARKSYACFLCGKPIAVGEKHELTTHRDHARVYSQRMHTSCEELTHDWDDMDWETFEPGTLPQKDCD